MTTRDADDLGVPSVELRKLAARGALTHLGPGVYRVNDVAATRWDQYAEAVALVGPGAFLSHDAVLALHELALVNPARLRVGTPRRVRTRLPDFVEVVKRQLPPEDLTAVEGIAATTVLRALLDCRGLVMPERLFEAVREAGPRGLLGDDPAVRRRLLRTLGALPTAPLTRRWASANSGAAACPQGQDQESCNGHAQRR